MNITRSNAIEFERGMLRTTLLIEQQADIINGLTIDDVNQTILQNLSARAIPLLNRLAGGLDLIALDRPLTADAVMSIQLGEFTTTTTIVGELFVNMDTEVLRTILISDAMPDISSAIVEKIGAKMFAHASVNAGYDEMLRIKMMERLGGGPFGSMPPMAKESSSQLGGMYL